MVHPRLNAEAAFAPASTAEPDLAGTLQALQVEDQVQCGLFLVLPLKSPAQMPALAATIQSVTDDVHRALRELHYVHYARFVPAPDYSALYVVTVFDGDPDDYEAALQSYLMDFVVTLGDVFNAMLDFVQGAPRLPVQRYPRDFIDFVRANNHAIPVWSAAPTATVIDILSTPALR